MHYESDENETLELLRSIKKDLASLPSTIEGLLPSMPSDYATRDDIAKLTLLIEDIRDEIKARDATK